MTHARPSIARRAVAELIGTAFLLAVIVGSGMMGEKLAGGNVAIALLANTIATGAGLVALVSAFEPISGAHLNPVVTLAGAMGGLAWRDVPTYVVAQVVGAFGGVVCAHIMFREPLLFASHHERSGSSQCVSELIATFGLLTVIWACARSSRWAAVTRVQSLSGRVVTIGQSRIRKASRSSACARFAMTSSDV